MPPLTLTIHEERYLIQAMKVQVQTSHLGALARVQVGLGDLQPSLELGQCALASALQIKTALAVHLP